MTDLILDFETRSRQNLTKTGASRYSKDLSTDVTIACYAYGNFPVRRWHPLYELPPQDLVTHVLDGGRVVAHNTYFERCIWNNVLRRRFPYLPVMAIEQMDCTMVRAFACNLPGKLEILAKVLGMPDKDMAGNAMMKKLSKPRRVDLVNNIVHWWTDPADQLVVDDYCEQDVHVERAVHAVLPPLTPDELQLWFIDQRINDRGIPIDRQYVVRAAELVEYAKLKAHEEISAATGGVVAKTTNVQAIVTWLHGRGIHTDSLRAGDRERLLDIAELLQDEDAIETIGLRATTGKTSTAKYKSTLLAIEDDDHVRGALQFGGAQQTMRWAGRVVQPQNYPRVSDDTEADVVAWVVGVTRDTTRPIHEVYDLIEMLGPPRLANGDKQDGLSTLAWMAKSLRSTIATLPGDVFVGGDFSNIEGRMNAWFAREYWKLQAFADYDAGTGPDLYNLAFARSFNVDIATVTKPQRQIGKVEELACGYQGGVGAFVTMVNTYLIKLPWLAKAIEATTQAADWDAMAAKHARARDSFALPENIWTAVKLAVVGWRKANPAIVASWWELQDAAILAVDRPFQHVYVYNGRVSYFSDQQFLYCTLPSGSVMMYAQPHLAQEIVDVIWDGQQWVDVEALSPVEVDLLLSSGYKIVSRKRRGVRFYGLDTNKRWTRKALYGGYQCENIVQKASRDVMAAAMVRAEAANYPLRLTVHDELLSVIRPRWYQRLDDIEKAYQCLLTQLPVWAPDFPMMAKTWTGIRYTK